MAIKITSYKELLATRDSFTIIDPSWSKELVVSVFATMPFGSSFMYMLHHL